MPGAAELGDRFGEATTSGDFDGDGFADLAVGVPGETVRGELRAGAVTVLRGGAQGLTSAGSRTFTQATTGVPGRAGREDAFGASLVAGRFNPDEFDDLAVAAPYNAGLVGSLTVLFGSPSGLIAEGARVFSVARLGRPATEYGGFGRALAAGDVTGDGLDDLAVAGVRDAYSLLSGPAGVGVAGNRHWTMETTGLDEVQQANPYGFTAGAVALGDVDADGHDDMLLGAPLTGPPTFDDWQCASGCDGAVVVLPGTASGPTRSGRVVLRREPGSVGYVEGGWGQALALGDLNGDGVLDAAVGAPVGGFLGGGAVVVFRGHRGVGLTALDRVVWAQDLPGVKGAVEVGDRFGDSLRIAQYGQTSYEDLAVGVPGESIGLVARAGGVAVLFGSLQGLTAVGDQFWSQNVEGVRGRSESEDLFGSVGTHLEFNPAPEPPDPLAPGA